VASVTRRTITAGLASITAVLALGIVATPAYAHAKLLRSDPATGSTVTTPVTAITLTFNEPVKQPSTVVGVVGADGVSYSEGAARVVDTSVIQAVRPLPAGFVQVSWKTVSADGDPVRGEIGFAVAPSAAPTTAPPTTAPPTTTAPEASAGATDPMPTVTSNTWIWPVVAAVGLIAALALGFLWRRKRREPER
jgi:methionine-rich copper-binding protein CopC